MTSKGGKFITFIIHICTYFNNVSTLFKLLPLDQLKIASWEVMVGVGPAGIAHNLLEGVLWA